MKFELTTSIQILERTPKVLRELLDGLDDHWIYTNEGGESWSPFDVIGHLIHGEKTDWIPRMEIILGDSQDKVFDPFDRFAQFEASKGKTLKMLLDEFETLRMQNLEIIKSKNLSASDFDRTAIHPSLGPVNLQMLLASLVVHDLGHIAQITRTMAKQYTDEIGPWKEYLPIVWRK